MRDGWSSSRRCRRAETAPSWQPLKRGAVAGALCRRGPADIAVSVRSSRCWCRARTPPSARRGKARCAKARRCRCASKPPRIAVSRVSFRVTGPGALRALPPRRRSAANPTLLAGGRQRHRQRPARRRHCCWREATSAPAAAIAAARRACSALHAGRVVAAWVVGASHYHVTRDRGRPLSSSFSRSRSQVTGRLAPLHRARAVRAALLARHPDLVVTRALRPDRRPARRPGHCWSASRSASRLCSGLLAVHWSSPMLLGEPPWTPRAHEPAVPPRCTAAPLGAMLRMIPNALQNAMFVAVAFGFGRALFEACLGRSAPAPAACCRSSCSARASIGQCPASRSCFVAGLRRPDGRARCSTAASCRQAVAFLVNQVAQQLAADARPVDAARVRRVLGRAARRRPRRSSASTRRARAATLRTTPPIRLTPIVRLTVPNILSCPTCAAVIVPQEAGERLPQVPDAAATVRRSRP